MTIDLTKELSKRFTGQYSSKLDDKRRIHISSTVRQVVAARSPDSPNRIWVAFDRRNDCDYLACFDSVRFGEIYEQVPGASVSNCKFDNQGRMALPELFVIKGGLEGCINSGSIVIAASPSMTHFEIWNKAFFEKGYAVKEFKAPLYEL